MAELAPAGGQTSPAGFRQRAREALATRPASAPHLRVLAQEADYLAAATAGLRAALPAPLPAPGPSPAPLAVANFAALPGPALARIVDLLRPVPTLEAAAMPQDEVPTRALEAATPELTLRQVCRSWRDAIDARPDLFHEATAAALTRGFSTGGTDGLLVRAGAYQLRRQMAALTCMDDLVALGPSGWRLRPVPLMHFTPRQAEDVTRYLPSLEALAIAWPPPAPTAALAPLTNLTALRALYIDLSPDIFLPWRYVSGPETPPVPDDPLPTFPQVTSLWLVAPPDQDDAVPRLLRALPALRRLDLEGPVNGARLAAAGELTALTSLALGPLTRSDAARWSNAWSDDAPLASLTRWRQLADLELTGMGNLPATDYAHLAPLTGLTRLCLGGPRHLDAGRLARLITPRLACLDLAGAPRVTALPLDVPTGLERLMLRDCPELVLAPVGRLRAPTRLRVLTVEACAKLALPSLGHLGGLQRLALSDTGATVGQMGEISRLTGLQELTLGDTAAVDDIMLLALHRLTALRTVRLDRLSDIDGSGLAVTRFWPNLSRLAVENAGLLANLGGLARAPALERLCLYKSPLRRSRALLGPLGDVRLLKELDLSFCEMLDPTALNALKRCRELVKLWLDDCPTVTDKALQHLFEVPKLAILSLRRCANITDQGVVAMAQCFDLAADREALEIIDLTDAPQITNRGRCQLELVVRYVWPPPIRT